MPRKCVEVGIVVADNVGDVMAASRSSSGRCFTTILLRFICQNSNRSPKTMSSPCWLAT